MFMNYSKGFNLMLSRVTHSWNSVGTLHIVARDKGAPHSE